MLYGAFDVKLSELFWCPVIILQNFFQCFYVYIIVDCNISLQFKSFDLFMTYIYIYNIWKRIHLVKAIGKSSESLNNSKKGAD